jgi:hypothetical protein
MMRHIESLQIKVLTKVRKSVKMANREHSKNRSPNEQILLVIALAMSNGIVTASVMATQTSSKILWETSVWEHIHHFDRTG